MVFISYRRSDTEGQAGRRFENLSNRFGKDGVFIDVKGIEKGRDFRKVIEQRTESSSVLIVMIGKDWVAAASEGGRRRLDNPGDFVRLEIAAALKRESPLFRSWFKTQECPGRLSFPMT